MRNRIVEYGAAMAFLLSIIATVYLLVGYYTPAGQSVSLKPHTCYAPCDVILPRNTEEDEWSMNYWVMARDRHPRVQVWVTKPNNK